MWSLYNWQLFSQISLLHVYVRCLLWGGCLFGLDYTDSFAWRNCINLVCNLSGTCKPGLQSLYYQIRMLQMGLFRRHDSVKPKKKSDKVLFGLIAAKLESGDYIFMNHAQHRLKDRGICDLEVFAT